MPAPTYKDLEKTRHPDYKCDYWKRIYALYAGGECITRDPEMLRELLPAHINEEAHVYKARLESVGYINYMGQIIDYIVASMANSPIELKYETVETEVAEMSGDPIEDEEAGEADVDEFYARFYDDTTPPSARKKSFNQMLRENLLNALLAGCSWTLLDLPEKGDREIRTRADEDAVGLRDVYACVLDPLQVVDWEEGDDGELLWARMRVLSCKREDPYMPRNTMHLQFVDYTPEGWTKWGFKYEINSHGEPKLPNDTDPATLEAEGKHSFGVVPLIRFDLPKGLWAGNKLENLAVSHLNKRSAFDWGTKKSMFQFLAAELSAPDPLNPVSEDPKRGVNQKLGPGRVWQGAKGDKMYYVAPESEPFKVALDDMQKLCEEMHRIMHHLALAVPQNAGALKRSADSKKQDSAATAVVLKGLGQLLREFAECLMEVVARGRGEYGQFEIEAQGGDEFEEVSLDALVEEASQVFTQIKIESAHFQRRYKFKVAKRLLGTDLTEKDSELIWQDLTENVTNEDITAQANPLGMLAGEGTDGVAAPKESEGAGKQGPAPSSAPKAKGKKGAPKKEKT